MPGLPGSWTALDVPVDPGTHNADGPHPDVSAVIAGLDLDPQAGGTPKREDGSESGAMPAPLAGLDLSAAPSKAAPASARSEAKDEAEDDEDEYEDVTPRGSGWPMTLLASYASAVTLGLLWVLWGHRLPASREGRGRPLPARRVTPPTPGIGRANPARSRRRRLSPPTGSPRWARPSGSGCWR